MPSEVWVSLLWAQYSKLPEPLLRKVLSVWLKAWRKRRKTRVRTQKLKKPLCYARLESDSTDTLQGGCTGTVQDACTEED